MRSSVTLTRAAAPLDAPATVAELRLNAAAPDGPAEDGLLRAILLAATQYVEEAARAVTAPCQAVERFPCFPPGRRPIELSAEPVRRVVMVTYFDADGVQRTLTGGDIQAWEDFAPPIVVPAPRAAWPATEPDRVPAVAVHYDCGPESPALCRPSLKLAVLNIATATYEHRDGWTRTGELKVSEFARGMIFAGSRRGLA